jgi:predicted dehydrogenase
MGGIGGIHARCYGENPHTELVAVCDQLRPAADAAAEAFGCPSFDSVRQLLDSQVKIDAASVTTAGRENGSHHYDPTMALLGAGIPVLGEKPISNRISEAKRMVALARRKKLPYAIDLNHRFTPAAKKARQWIQNGRLGELCIINMRLWIDNPNESSPHFHMRALHPHSIDVMRYFCGDVRRVQAFFKKGKGRRIWSNVQVNMQFASGVIGHLTGSYDAGPVYGLEFCEIVGSDARVVIRDAAESLEFYPRRSNEVEIYAHPGGMGGFADTFQSRIDAWVDDLRKKTPPDRIDGRAQDALDAQKIIEAAIKSWEKGTVEKV